jgi:hypothetical protein
LASNYDIWGETFYAIEIGETLLFGGEYCESEYNQIIYSSCSGSYSGTMADVNGKWCPARGVANHYGN